MEAAMFYEKKVLIQNLRKSFFAIEISYSLWWRHDVVNVKERYRAKTFNTVYSWVKICFYSLKPEICSYARKHFRSP